MKYGNKELEKVASGIYKSKDSNFYFKFKINSKQYFFNATKEYRVKNKTQAKSVLDEVKYSLRKKGTKDIKLKTFEFYFKEHLKDYTSENTLSIYNRHWDWISSFIGYLKPNQIKPETIQDILRIVYIDKGDTVKEKLKFILNPVFRKLLKEGLIDTNPLDRVTFPKPKTELEPLPQRLQIPEKNIEKVAQDVFSSIQEIQDKRGKKNKKLFYLFSIMLLRRRSEILKYTYEDIKDGYLFIKKEYTKHQKSEIILLPEEILQEIKKLNIKETSEPLIKIHFTWASTYFKTIAEKYPKMRLHDLRSTFFIVMFQKAYSMDLLDVCLSHSIKGTRKHYLTSTDTKKEEVFKEWWDILRDKN